MNQPRPSEQMPLVLLINDEEWMTRSIESVLRPRGYGVLMAYTGRQGLDLAARVPPDLVFVDLKLPDIGGIDLCSRLRELPGGRPSTPIILFTSGAASRTVRIEAYRAGAWDVVDTPFDPQELLARLDPFIRAKRDTDLAVAAADVDTATGCYNSRGLMRRLAEVFSETRRTRRPVACVIIGPPLTGDDVESGTSGRQSHETSRWMSETLREVTRGSDAVARIGPSDFAVLAPGTDEEGAIRLIERLVERAVSSGRPSRIDPSALRIGLASVSGTDPDMPAPEELLRRAAKSVREGAFGAHANGNRIRASRN